MSFYINENSIRKGNRGGKENFNWEDVRLLNYKDRECYLGISDKIGYLDKGYMWKKNDWWMKNKDNKELSEIEDERKKVIEMEEKEYNKYLSKDNNSNNHVNQFEFKEKKEDEKRKINKNKDKLLISNIKNLLGIKREDKKKN